MVAFLARRNLLRNRTRTLLLWLGISVSGALLYDMVMLSGGLETSFKSILQQMNFDLRLTPRGSLPFASDVTFRRATPLLREVQSDPRVVLARGFYGTTLYWRRMGGAGGGQDAQPQSCFALAVAGPAPELFRARAGRMVDPVAGRCLWISAQMARRAGIAVGDTLEMAGPGGVEMTRFSPGTRLPVVAIGEFRFDAQGQNSVVISLPLARALRAVESEDPLSLIAIRLRNPGLSLAVARDFRARFPQAQVYEVRDLLQRVHGQLSYFTQFSAVLGTLSFFVAWLLISTLLTLSLGDRLGEMAVLRAMGIKPARLVQVLLAESLASVLIGVPSALLLGLLTARYLDRILMMGPGLPVDLHFFVVTPQATLGTVALLFLAGLLGALVPMARVARLPIAATLHECAT